eukprot:c2636_g1_i1.p1 GENE.c2636_g1_i1~~c2636_g1_i1.p1  ORF type:complete len:280 (+),score=40.23 c2636_g1_i1:23-862(+)
MGAGTSKDIAETTVSVAPTARASDVPTASVAASDDPFEDGNGTASVRPVQVPHLFKWSHGGHEVFLTGTFNSWREKIPLKKTNADSCFTTLLSLPAGYYEYKFIVDNQWRFSPDQPTTSDPVGNINNFIEIVPMRATDSDSEISESNSIPAAMDEYGQYSCDPDEFIKEPPELPPHFRQPYLPLNQVNPSNLDLNVLPSPSHVLLNHTMYGSRIITTATLNAPIKDSSHIVNDVLKVAMCHRFRGKFVTTILHKPMPPRQIQLQLYLQQQMLQHAQTKT